MVRSGGILSLWGGLPPLLLREILFSLPKFVVFNSASAAIFYLLPAAQETIGLSLLVSPGPQLL